MCVHLIASLHIRVDHLLRAFSVHHLFSIISLLQALSLDLDIDHVATTLADVVVATNLLTIVAPLYACNCCYS